MKLSVLALALFAVSASAANLRTVRADPGGLSDATKQAIAVQGSAAVARDGTSESTEASVVRGIALGWPWPVMGQRARVRACACMSVYVCVCVYVCSCVFAHMCMCACVRVVARVHVKQHSHNHRDAHRAAWQEC